MITNIDSWLNGIKHLTLNQRSVGSSPTESTRIMNIQLEIEFIDGSKKVYKTSNFLIEKDVIKVTTLDNKYHKIQRDKILKGTVKTQEVNLYV